MFSKKTQNGQRKSLLAGASVLAAAAAAMTGTPAMAQDADAEEDVIVVTGSRIPQPNLTGTSPVTQVTAEDITTQGVTRVEDLTNQLPQVFAAQGSNYSNGATGTAQVNLRGLGAQRTLVLINGRRMPYGSPNSSPADVNQIPGQMVERVEILTGGASAIYGSDAVAGVVNFIMRDDFEGLRLDAQYGWYQHSNDFDEGYLREVIAARGATNPAQFQLPEDDQNDGFSKEVTAIFGASSPDNRGNVTGYMTYRVNDQVLQRDRDFSHCALGPPSTAPVTGVPAGATHWTCGGSGTSNPGTFTDFGLNSFDPLVFFNPRGLDNIAGNGDDPTPAQIAAAFAANQTAADRPSFNYTLDTANASRFRPFVAATDQYNFGPTNYYQRPDERYALGAFAHYEINDRVEAYAEMMYNDYRSTSQIAPSGDFFNTGTVNCDNPLLGTNNQLLLCGNGVTGFKIVSGVAVPDLGADNAVGGINSPGAETFFGNDPNTAFNEAADDVINTDSLPCPDPDLVTPGNQCVANLYIGRRNVEGGGRQDDLNYQSYRTVIGFRGPINDAWDYDVSATYARVSLARTYKNDFSVTRLNRAINVVDTDPGPGVTPTCQSVVDGTDPNCVPYNIFSANSVTPAALAYLQIPLMQTGETIQQNVVATVAGDLGFGSPAAESNIQTAFGVEYRRDELNTTTDTSFSSGDGAGQGGPTLGLNGVTDAFEIFGEARVPLVEGAPFADLISLDLAYRFSSYMSGVETDTYKIGADWAPTEDIRFRGSFARAVRAANVIELFSSQGAGLFDMADDPCDLTDPADNGVGVAAVCQGTAAYQVTAGQAGGGGLNSPAGQYNGLFGGNPNLAPESADTITIGLVFTPRFIEGLAVSIDYFNIDVVDTVGTVDPTLTVSDCFLAGNLSSCSLITRNPGTGQLWVGAGQVSALNTNIGGLSTVGIDINADYSFEIGSMGSLGFQLVGTYLDELVTDPGAITGVQPYDCVGFFASACGTPNPDWRHRFRVNWETPVGLDLNFTWRHFAEVNKASAGFTTNGHLPVLGVLDSTFDAENYFDIAGTYSLYENTKLRFGVNNVTDNDPPISNSVGAGAGNGNTYPQVYDSLGRWIFVGATVDF